MYRGSRVYALLVTCSVSLPAGTIADERWPQWGGSKQDFRVEDNGLASEWPESGPRELWRRGLGAGYSAIVAQDGRLYTMYRSDGKEVVISVDAVSGKTLWEYQYEALPAPGHKAEYGNGPNATPLITDGRVYTIGIAGAMCCLDAGTGRLLWSQDLWHTFEGNVLEFGYSSSPIAYKGTVIALVGGKNQSIVAFDQKDGHVVWKNLSFQNSYSTPRILRILDENQLVTFMATEVIGADPDTGALLWQYPIANRWKQNICMPTLLGDDLLFISSLEAGSRGLKLSKADERFKVEEIWSTRKVGFFHVSSVRLGDHVFGWSGYRSAPLMSAVNMRTGQLAWRKRGFARANVVGVGDRLVILDEEGILALATATSDSLTVHSKFQLLEPPAWTVPTIVDKTLYVRDTTTIVALDLR